MLYDVRALPALLHILPNALCPKLEIYENIALGDFDGPSFIAQPRFS